MTLTPSAAVVLPSHFKYKNKINFAFLSDIVMTKGQGVYIGLHGMGYCLTGLSQEK
jgi:hypothetical protein